MPANPFAPVLRSIRKTLGVQADQSADALLLERFLLKDESAFAALVERHGSLVWGTCRRAAGDAHAAEDAFQATWIVLSRKAASVKDGGSLPGWLHRVAFRLALAARARPSASLEDAPAEAPGPEDAAALKEVREAIDEEVNRLPQKYRLPVVLCFFAGRSHAEAAAELGWPVGTVAGRVARAKDLLKARLTRRGLAPTDDVPVLVACGPVPAALASAAVTAVAAFAVGGTAGGAAHALAKAMLAEGTRRRGLAVAAVLLLSCLVAAAGVVAWRALSPQDSPDRKDPPEFEPHVERTPRFTIPVDGVVALSPGDKWLAGSKDGRVRLYDPWEDREVRALAIPGEDRRVRAFKLMFSPDGRWLAGIVEDVEKLGSFSLHVWKTETGDGVTCMGVQWGWETDRVGVKRDHLGGFVPGKDQLISGHGERGKDKPGLMQLWDVRTGRELRTFEGGFGSLSRDGKLLATYDTRAPRAVRVYEVSSGKELVKLPTYLDLPPVFHPDGEAVALQGETPHLWKWKAPPETRSVSLGGWPREIGSRLEAPLLFSPDGQLAAWDRVGRGIDPEDNFWHVHVTQLASVHDGKLLRTLGDGPPLAFSPDGKRLVAGGWLCDVASGERLCPAPRTAPVYFFRGGRTILTSNGTLWDARPGRQQGALTGYDGGKLAFSRDGLTLVSVSDEKLTLWKLATGEKRVVSGKAEVSRDGKSVGGVELNSPLGAWSPDDGRTKVASKDGKIWAEVETAPSTQDLPPTPGSPRPVVVKSQGKAGPEGTYAGVRGVAFCGGNHLALGFENGTVRLWDVCVDWSPP